jgi:hypothetical protein
VEENRLTTLIYCALATVVLLLPVHALADSTSILGKSGPVYNTNEAQDTAVFDAVNRCDLAKLSTFLGNDVEFYQDRERPSVGKQPFLDDIKTNVCGEFTRVLVPGTVEVFPLPKYGALEIGVHRFVHADPASPPERARFVHIWKKTGGHWQLTRIVSFDHSEASK